MDNAATRSTWGGDPADVPAGGGVGYELNNLEVPDDMLMAIYQIILHVGDWWGEGLSPGEYTEHWIYKGDAGLPYGDADWTQRVSDDDFITHLASGYGGIEDTASGTGAAVTHPGPIVFEPSFPILSATGELSEAWEGDAEQTGNNSGEWALMVQYELFDAPRDDIVEELLREH